VTPAASSVTPTPILPARSPRGSVEQSPLLVIDPLTRRFGDYTVAELPQLLGHGDVLLLNDAATLPASLRAGPELELRLVAAENDGTFWSVTFGSGDQSVPTELRGEPRRLRLGEPLVFGSTLTAHVVAIDDVEPRLVCIAFVERGAALWRGLYAHARPIQYSYLREPLELWNIQNRFAARPWAFELPSAAHALTFETLFELERRGAMLGHVTHAASISSTGRTTLDARLPLAERYEIGAAAAALVGQAQRSGGRVIAAGTSVARALEGHVSSAGLLQAGTGRTDLRLGPGSELRVVDGLLTGLHEPGTSHFELLEAFAPRELLLRATDHAGRTGYLQHEFGDSCLVLPGALLERLTA
jgi:S-adenosylmethionine:tRNA ribosyltransferase-isomerase